MLNLRYIYDEVPLEKLTNHYSLWSYTTFGGKEEPVVHVQLFLDQNEAKEEIKNFCVTTCVVADKSLTCILADNGNKYEEFLLLCNLVTRTRKYLETLNEPKWYLCDKVEMKRRVTQRNLHVHMEDLAASVKALVYVYSTDFRKINNVLGKLNFHINSDTIDEEFHERFTETTDENVRVDVTVDNILRKRSTCFFSSDRSEIHVVCEVKMSH